MRVLDSIVGRFGRSSAAVAFLFLCVFATAALAQNVTVRGNQRVDEDTIRSAFALQPGETLSDEKIRRGERDLLSTGQFRDVRAARAGNGVAVTVVENAVVNRVTFEGNSKVKTDILTGEVQTKSRGPFSRAQVDSDVERIREIYRRSGRGDAKIEAKVTDAPNGRTDVAFVIVEGDKTGVSTIDFVGNKAFSGYRLRNVMTTTESNFLSFLKTSDIYDPERLASDLELIRRYYLKNGYADFRVVDTDVHLDSEKKGYVITITLDEGDQYSVGAVNVESRIPDVDVGRLKSSVRSSTGDVYNAEAVERSVEEINKQVAARGYAFAQVRPRGDRDPVAKQIGLSFVVEQGPRVYVERINIRGNTRTRDYVIRREFDLGEGDAYNRILVDKAERRLKSLGYFKTVKVTNEPGSAPDRIIINVEVEDQPTGAFQIGGGYSTADGVLGDLSITEKNFLGRGQYAKLGFSLGQRTQGVEFSFTEPYFLDQRIAAGFDIFSKYQDNTKVSRFESTTTGFTLRAAFPIDDNFTVGTRYSLFQQDIKIPNTSSQPYNDCSVPIPGLTPAIGAATVFNSCLTNGEASVAIKESRGSTLTSLAGLTFIYNTLDTPESPTKGLILDVRPDVAGLGGDSQYLRVSGDARYYYPLYEDITGLVRFQGGHVEAIGGQPLRLLDHYFLGPSLVRGFSASGIGPRDGSPGVDSSSNAIGGTTYFGGSLEAQFPIFGLPRELGLRGAVFADAGSLFDYKGRKFFDLNGNGVRDCTVAAPVVAQSECLTPINNGSTIRSSVGVSLLWSSPLGPIRFDVAQALSKARGDQTQFFRFGGGTAF